MRILNCNSYILGILMLCIFALQGCSKYDEIIAVDWSEYITFSAKLASENDNINTKSVSSDITYIQEDWLLELNDKTKSSPVLQLQDAGKAGVIGFSKSAGSNWKTFISNVEYFFDGDELRSLSPVPWSTVSKDESISIYSYAPKSVAQEVIYNENTASFSYTAVPDISKQVDIIAAKNIVSADHKAPVQLTYNHALTAIRFNTEEKDVASVTIKGVYNTGTYNIGGEWSSQTSSGEGVEYTVTDLTSQAQTLMLIPQKLPEGASIELKYKNGSTIRASLAGKEWKPGKMVTYTLKTKGSEEVVYFDLAAGEVELDGTNGKKSSGYVYTENSANPERIEVVHSPDITYHVYQSTSSNRNTTGKRSNGSFILPVYNPVYSSDNRLWSDFITNNTDVDGVIEEWVDAVTNAGREGTSNRITVKGCESTTYNLVIDNIYSTYQVKDQHRTTGGICFSPNGISNCILDIVTIGDNRLGNIHYSTGNDDKGSRIIFGGNGSLTVADVNLSILGCASGYNVNGYFGNFYCSAIGGNDDGGANEQCRGIVINSGVLFAGTTVAENCSAIGGGGNGIGEITINGGTVTAVASTTGTAIGGGIGYSSKGGKGIVTINGGNVYAYNLDNKRGIPSSAIGGAGSSASEGTEGTVNINGGNIYAFSALGTAIGGGSSRTLKGGDATVTISGGMVVAKSAQGAGIGGGSACTGGKNDSSNKYDGGTATIYISGNPIIRTGSIGGGNSSDPNGGKIGSANITIEGGDIQAQFVMASGAKATPSFSMTGGTIRKNNVYGTEYKYVKTDGGAVYLEDGTFTMQGGTITDCRANRGGAVYIKGSASTTFTMTGGDISNCVSENGGGAVYLDGGNVSISGKAKINYNVARNGNGGGVCINNGNFSMEGGLIDSNSAFSINNSLNNGNFSSFGKGGGVYVASEGSVKVYLIGGEIKGNTSAMLGGGICVEMGNSNTSNAEITVGTKTNPSNQFPKVTGNHTLIKGGGLYVSGINSNMSIYSGTLKQNSTSGYVPNPDVVNEGGMVTLLSESATTSVKLTFDPNGGSVNGNYTDLESILIVSATNSIVKTERVYNRDGYNLVGWHTRKDANDNEGKAYMINDGLVTINTEKDLTLYALWQKQN